MSTINTGGSAFPVVVDLGQRVEWETGMSIRDYFAAKAMQALYTSMYEWESTGHPRQPEFVALMDELAYDAYQMADSMLKARNKNDS